MTSEQNFSILSSMKVGILSGVVGGVQAGTILSLLPSLTLVTAGIVATLDYDDLVDITFGYDDSLWFFVLIIGLWWLIMAILGGLIGLLGGAFGGPLLVRYVAIEYWAVLATLLGAVLGFLAILVMGLLDSPQNVLGLSGEVIGMGVYATITGALGGYLGGRRLRNRQV